MQGPRAAAARLLLALAIETHSDAAGIIEPHHAPCTEAATLLAKVVEDAVVHLQHARLSLQSEPVELKQLHLLLVCQRVNVHPLQAGAVCGVRRVR